MRLPEDPDGAIRRFEYSYHSLHSFAVVAAELATGHPISASRFQAGTLPIDFVGPSETIRSIPYSKLLLGQSSPSAVRGKIVIVGASVGALLEAANRYRSGGYHARAVGLYREALTPESTLLAAEYLWMATEALSRGIVEAEAAQRNMTPGNLAQLRKVAGPRTLYRLAREEVVFTEDAEASTPSARRARGSSTGSRRRRTGSGTSGRRPARTFRPRLEPSRRRLESPSVGHKHPSGLRLANRCATIAPANPSILRCAAGRGKVFQSRPRYEPATLAEPKRFLDVVPNEGSTPVARATYAPVMLAHCRRLTAPRS